MRRDTVGPTSALARLVAGELGALVSALFRTNLQPSVARWRDAALAANFAAARRPIGSVSVQGRRANTALGPRTRCIVMPASRPTIWCPKCPAARAQVNKTIGVFGRATRLRLACSFIFLFFLFRRRSRPTGAARARPAEIDIIATIMQCGFEQPDRCTNSINLHLTGLLGRQAGRFRTLALRLADLASPERGPVHLIKLRAPAQSGASSGGGPTRLMIMLRHDCNALMSHERVGLAALAKSELEFGAADMKKCAQSCALAVVFWGPRKRVTGNFCGHVLPQPRFPTGSYARRQACWASWGGALVEAPGRPQGSQPAVGGPAPLQGGKHWRLAVPVLLRFANLRQRRNLPEPHAGESHPGTESANRMYSLGKSIIWAASTSPPPPSCCLARAPTRWRCCQGHGRH